MSISCALPSPPFPNPKNTLCSRHVRKPHHGARPMTHKHKNSEPGFFARLAQQFWNRFRKDGRKKIAGAASEVCNLCSHLEPKAPAAIGEADQLAGGAGESWVSRTMAS